MKPSNDHLSNVQTTSSISPRSSQPQPATPTGLPSFAVAHVLPYQLTEEARVAHHSQNRLADGPVPAVNA